MTIELLNRDSISINGTVYFIGDKLRITRVSNYYYEFDCILKFGLYNDTEGYDHIGFYVYTDDNSEISFATYTLDKNFKIEIIGHK